MDLSMGSHQLVFRSHPLPNLDVPAVMLPGFDPFTAKERIKERSGLQEAGEPPCGERRRKVHRALILIGGLLHRAWAEVGYPLDRLVPSFATAIGSSADRPSALAEVVGTALRGGLRYPVLSVSSLHFAEDTPYETVMTHHAAAPERVFSEVVAEAVRGAWSTSSRGEPASGLGTPSSDRTASRSSSAGLDDGRHWKGRCDQQTEDVAMREKPRIDREQCLREEERSRKIDLIAAQVLCLLKRGEEPGRALRSGTRIIIPVIRAARGVPVGEMRRAARSRECSSRSQ